jgi:ribosome-binding ATPase YchF (GTP1/OBG family)
MSISIGIVGLPNVGKSTTFNALTGAQNAVVANYPFCTIQPNRAIVPLPDQRLDRLGELVRVPEVKHAPLEFVDIAGLVKDAHKGEGLGNQFLGHIRDTAAILHVVRCFDDPNVVHVSEKPAPRQDIEVIDVELALADLQQLERKIERLASAVKGDKKLQLSLDLAYSLKEHLARGLPAAKFDEADSEIFNQLYQEMRFLTSTPAGAETSGLEQVIRKSFEMLHLISFFTFNQNEARAWNIPRGVTAPQAAGAIHTDFERGFIRAEVIPFDVFEHYGSSTAVKSAGLMRLEGKEYIVQDGDVIYFRFNV